MSFTALLTGHGSWKPTDGYVEVPKGCSISFMIHHAKTLPTMDMYALCNGSYANWGKPERVISAMKQCPDMTWTADETRKMKQCERALKKNEHISQGTVLYPNMMDFARLRKKSKKGKKAKRTVSERRQTNLSDFFAAYDSQIEAWVAQHGAVEFIWCCCCALSMNKTEEGKSIGINATQGIEKYGFKSGTSVRVESLL
jgi:hypothetical protein